MLPNREITSKPIVNLTARAMRRADIAVGIDYGDSIPRARAVLLRIAEAEDGVLENPAPSVLVTNLGDSSVDLVLRIWAKTPELQATRSNLLEAIHHEFGQAGINIPYPRRDLHVYHKDVDGRPLSEVLPHAVRDDVDLPDTPAA